MRLATLFVSRKLYDDARNQLDIVIKTKEREQLQPSWELRHMTEETWFRQADGKRASFHIDYMNITDSLIYDHASGIVTTNKAGTALFLKTSKLFIHIPNEIAKNVRKGEKHEALITESFDRKRNEWGWKCVKILK